MFLLSIVTADRPIYVFIYCYSRHLCFLSIVAADIYDDVFDSIKGLGFDSECVGGGRIQHEADKKAIKVFGYSQVIDTTESGTNHMSAFICLWVEAN